MNRKMFKCTRCDIEKPFPAEFMSNYKKMETCNKCKECRKVMAKASRLRSLGTATPEDRWNHAKRRETSPLFPKSYPKSDI